MRDEFTKWQDYAKRGKLLDENGISTGQPHPTALNISWFGWEARAKLTKPLSLEQRKALIESAINAADEDGLLPDMERFAWMIDAVERSHGIVSATRRPLQPESEDGND